MSGSAPTWTFSASRTPNAPVPSGVLGQQLTTIDAYTPIDQYSVDPVAFSSLNETLEGRSFDLDQAREYMFNELADEFLSAARDASSSEQIVEVNGLPMAAELPWEKALSALTRGFFNCHQAWESFVFDATAVGHPKLFAALDRDALPETIQPTDEHTWNRLFKTAVTHCLSLVINGALTVQMLDQRDQSADESEAQAESPVETTPADEPAELETHSGI